EQFSSTRSDPAFPSSDLTLRAMTITAAVIRDGGTMPATGALIEMSTECGGTTPANGQQHFDVLPTEPVTISFDESISRGADQIGHLEWWPGHLLFLRPDVDCGRPSLTPAQRRKAGLPAACC